MKVVAKCITKVWDSDAAVMYEPGLGPLPGGLYEIERDGPLSKIKLGSTYSFEFDRNAGPDDKPHDYSCKVPDCGAMFKTLAALGSHTRTAHKEVRVESDEEVVLAVDGRGKKKDKTFTCKTCGETLPNLYAMGQHNKVHAKAIEEVAEPALA